MDYDVSRRHIGDLLGGAIKGAFAIAAAYALAGCQIGTEIAVEMVGGKTVFSITRNDGQPACVTSINVSEGNGAIGAKSRWNLIQNYEDVKARRNACHAVFVFGQPISGYDQQYDGGRLDAGATYNVSISGGGLTGEKTFIAAR